MCVCRVVLFAPHQLTVLVNGGRRGGGNDEDGEFEWERFDVFVRGKLALNRESFAFPQSRRTLEELQGCRIRLITGTMSRSDTRVLDTGSVLERRVCF